jgi:hypothetical protein
MPRGKERHRQSSKDQAWIMWGGTPYEHLMVPIK